MDQCTSNFLQTKTYAFTVKDYYCPDMQSLAWCCKAELDSLMSQWGQEKTKFINEFQFQMSDVPPL